MLHCFSFFRFVLISSILNPSSILMVPTLLKKSSNTPSPFLILLPSTATFTLVPVLPLLLSSTIIIREPPPPNHITPSFPSFYSLTLLIRLYHSLPPSNSSFQAPHVNQFTPHHSTPPPPLLNTIFLLPTSPSILSAKSLYPMPAYFNIPSISLRNLS